MHLQDKFLIPLFQDDLGYKEVKANIIGWSALQLKDLRRPDVSGQRGYVYDKIMIVIVVDRSGVVFSHLSPMFSHFISQHLVVYSEPVCLPQAGRTMKG